MKYNDREEREDRPNQRLDRDWSPRDDKDKRAKRRQYKEKDRYGYEE
jgi:hypothetical protein